MKPLVKICGLTRPSDAALAVSLGASHVGAVLAPDSPRFVRPEQAREVFAAASGRAATVGVFKGVPVDDAIRAAHRAEAEWAQLYDASDDDVARFRGAGLRVLRVHRIDAEDAALPRISPEPTEDAPALLDVGGGGSGRRFDWALLGERAPHATFVAGGIGPLNVGELLPYRPYGIDLSSGVESAPGVKDEKKMKALFEVLS